MVRFLGGSRPAHPSKCGANGIVLLRLIGANSSTGGAVAWFSGCIDAVRGTIEDRYAADSTADHEQTTGAAVDDRVDAREHGATRVIEHPVLGALAPAPVVVFTFDGERVEGLVGEPIAAALIAAGFRVFRTMPRFGDARGGYCMVGRCTDCLVEVDGAPNVRACVTPVGAGLDVRAQHGAGEPGTDAAQMMDR